MLRKGLILFTALTLASSAILALPSQAIPTPIVAKAMSLITKISGTEIARGVLVKKSNIYVFGTIVGFASTDGNLQAFDETGSEKWNLALDSGENDIATAGAVDSFGNIWIAGSSSKPVVEPTPSPTPSSNILNPDSATVVSEIATRVDATIVTLWKVSSTGDLLDTYSVDVGRAILVRNILVTKNSISIVGIAVSALGSCGFLLQSDLNGVFSKIHLIGSKSTVINKVMKKGNNLLLLGSSDEKLYSKPVLGLRDGIVLTLSESASFISILRSFNSQISRSWNDSTSTNFFGGIASTGQKSDAVVTKFSSKFSPEWTTRFPAARPAQVIDATTTLHIALIASTGAITGLKGWKPTTNGTLIALIFDKNGILTSAYRPAGMAESISAGYSKELGLVVLAQGKTGISIFHAQTL